MNDLKKFRVTTLVVTHMLNNNHKFNFSLVKIFDKEHTFHQRGLYLRNASYF